MRCFFSPASAWTFAPIKERCEGLRRSHFHNISKLHSARNAMAERRNRLKQVQRVFDKGPDFIQVGTDIAVCPVDRIAQLE